MTLLSNLKNAERFCLLGSAFTEGTCCISIKSCQGGNFSSTDRVSPKVRYRLIFCVFGTVTEVSPADSCNWALTSVAEGWLEDRVIKQSSNFPVSTLGLWSSIMIILTSLRKYENKFFSQGGCLVHILVQYDYEAPQ